MALRYQNDQIGLPFVFSLEDLIDDTALGNDTFVRPTCSWQINQRHSVIGSDMKEPELTGLRIQAARQQRSFVDRQLRIGVMIHGDKHSLEVDGAIGRIDESTPFPGYEQGHRSGSSRERLCDRLVSPAVEALPLVGSQDN